MATQFEPDWAEPPGSLIKTELDALEYSQSDVAARANVSTKHFNQLLNGHVPLSPDIAISLERVLGIPAEITLRMDATWQAERVRRASSSVLAGLSRWIDKFPREALRKYQIIDFQKAVEERADELLRFFRVADEKSFDRIWLAPQVNYRRSQKFTVDPYATALWRRLAEVKAEALVPSARAYDAVKLRRAAERIPPLTQMDLRRGFQNAIDILADAGVLLVFIPEIDGTRISGATWWLTPSHPIIALTGRYRFVDTFWFTMVHEIAHVLLHPKRVTFMHFDRKGSVSDDQDRQETAADSFAADTFLTDKQRCALVLLTTVADVEEFAAKTKLSVGVVAGQYAHCTGNWSRFGKMRESVDIAAAIAH
ncbi:ImmA/IrrE family metallo-endopeptidase [Mycobacterium kubicae]|uniref:ImmA/IrrE family metallo-endopeptidase n=1 Tax=Mycobacterium kubicae TaxID=120959 RepID=A0AAX1J9I5_9MYCO|nr:ImmA/IrrE family metallo-endopeptidase [Mycobacterium kubicae]MCV7094253.1 ImmA/IrrE family metallo-endopeptidase [Mycobacterium kubicae]QPI38135.1 ImmA/IrrE family metallo-endopeptidase [Mycobacterium kubicae]